jgi:protein-tyrosine phosphatase
MLAAYFILKGEMSAKDAIIFIRSKRPRSIETGNQIARLEQFEEMRKRK